MTDKVTPLSAEQALTATTTWAYYNPTTHTTVPNEELAGLRKDAERYRAYKSLASSHDDYDRTLNQEGFIEFILPSIIEQHWNCPRRIFDEAFDAAIAKERPNNG